MTVLLHYFLVYLAFLSTLGLIGFVACLPFRRKFKPTLFESLLVFLFAGYILAITLFAVYQTSFRTINLCYVLLLLFVGWEVYKIPSKQGLKIDEARPVNFAVVLGASFMFFALAFYSVYNPSGYIPFFYDHGDYILYAKVAKYLPATGEENGFSCLNELDKYYHGPEPYHFFDTWGAAFVSSFFGINEYLSLRLVVYPFFYLLSFLAAVCLLVKPGLSKILLTFSLLWFGGFYLSAYARIHFLRDLSNISANLFNPNLYKLSYFYVFFLAAYLLFRQRRYSLALLTLLGLAVGNVISVPTLLIALLVISCVLLRFNLITWAEFRANLLYLLVFVGCMAAFYGLLKTERSGGLPGVELSSPWLLIQDLLDTSGWKTQRNIVAGSIIFLVVLYAPLIMVRVSAGTTKLLSSPAVAFVAVSVSASIFLWALLYQELNASQIFYNFSIPILNVSAIILLVRIFEGPWTNNWSTIGVGAVIAGVLTLNVAQTLKAIDIRRNQPHSNAYIQQIDERLPDGALVASIKAPIEMTEMHTKYNVAYPLGDFLFMLDKNYNTVNMGDMQTPIDTSSLMNKIRSQKAIRDGLFYRFAMSDENKGLSTDDLTVKFLRKFNITFLIASRDAVVPPGLGALTKHTITDAASGERFIEIDLSQVLSVELGR